MIAGKKALTQDEGVRVGMQSDERTRAHRRSLRLHGIVAHDLGVLIVAGHYQPGDLLDGEIEASERFSVSRTAYREAVRILAAKGLIEVRPKVGTRVLRREKWHLLDPDVLSWIFEGDPDDHLLKSLFELRNMVEPKAAELAAERRTAEQLVRMENALQEMAEYTLATGEGRLADQQFHEALLEASDNPFLANLTSGIGAAIEWTTIFKQRGGPLTRDPMPDHIRVFQAIAASDGSEARRAMAHLVDMALIDTTTAPRGSPRLLSSLRPRGSRRAA
jgi:DNA-binding FadR family transcriptional regulator